MSENMTITPEIIKNIITTSLDDDKAEDVIAIDMLGRSSVADYIVVASGRSTRQVYSMATNIVEKLQKAGLKLSEPEGIAHGDWVVVDAFDVIVHLFRPEVRSFYHLERLWGVDTPGYPPAHMIEGNYSPLDGANI
ncbi:MAG: ribosome silencing factor [Alphaproteobacteria bacterium]